MPGKKEVPRSLRKKNGDDLRGGTKPKGVSGEKKKGFTLVIRGALVRTSRRGAGESNS